VETVKYVIKYKLGEERRFDFAHLKNGDEAEAIEALKKIHGDTEVFTEIKVSKAL